MKLSEKNMLLYAITDRNLLGNMTMYQQIEETLKGGTTIIQLREKNLDKESFINEAKEIKQLCNKYNVPLIINDNADVALKTDAHGVHVGQKDMKVEDVRKIIGSDKIIGVSAHSVKEAVIAEKNGADYLGVGAVFSTNSKSDVKRTSFETLREICNTVNIPVVAIGGITQDNAFKLSGSGISGIAVISAIFSKNDICSATENLYKIALKITSEK